MMASNVNPNNVDIIDVIILYEKDTGQIRHTHFVGFVKGGKNPPTKEENEQRAFKLAKEKGLHKLDNLMALHVLPTDLKHDIIYRVDLNTKAAVPSDYTRQ